MRSSEVRGISNTNRLIRSSVARVRPLARRGARALLAVCLTLSFTLAAPVQPSFAAVSHYVSPTGSATWAASTNISTPCSIATAASNYAAGDIIELAAGTYSSRVTFARSGTSGSRVTINGQPGVIFSKGFRVTGRYIDLTGHQGDGGQTSGVDGQV